MSNEYFNFTTGRMVSGEDALAEDVNAAFDAVVAGFEKLPDPADIVGDAGGYCAATGSGGNYILSISTVIKSYTNGNKYVFMANHSNPGASATINVNSIGAIPLLGPGGLPLATGDIQSGYIYSCRYISSRHSAILETLTGSNLANIQTVSDNIADVQTIADNIDEILLADSNATAAAASASYANARAIAADASANLAAASAANLPNATTAGANKVVVSNSSGNGWEYPASSIFLQAAHHASTSTDHDDRYYTETEVNALFTNHHASTSTDHDDRYYTESECNSKFEEDLGNPSTSGMILSSTTAGVRSWKLVSPITIRVFATVGETTYTPTAGATKCIVEVVGGGGSGGGSGSGLNSAAGGAAGGYSRRYLSLVGITSVVVIVGAGGAGVSGAVNGNPGETSSFGSYCSATGGNGGRRWGDSGQTINATPGSGAGGHINLYGGVGGVSSTNAGEGGASYFGGGNKRGYSFGAPGSGGQGAIETSATSAWGRPGIVIITEY